MSQTSRFGRNEQVSSVIASVVAAAVAGASMNLVGGAGAVEQFAKLIGENTLAAGWTVWLVQGVVFGVVFALVAARMMNAFTDSIIRVSQRSTLTRKLLVPMLQRSALTVTAGSMGFLYGEFVLVPLFAYIAPVALGLQGYSVGVPLATGPVILGYIIYGSVLGATYGLLLETKWFDMNRIADEHSAALVGAVGGGIAGTGVLAAVGGTELLAALGELSGAASARRGALLFMAAAVVLGLAFSWVLARTINDFTNTVIMFSRRSKLTQKILVPLLTRAALTVTAGSMGLIYGLGLGGAAVGLGAVGVIPETGLAGLLAGTVYGNVLGYGYGMMMEDVDFSGLGPSEEQRAGLVGSVGAGLLSGGFIALALGRSVFGDLATLVGRTQPVTGVAIWMGVAVVFGLVFVAYVSRTINDFTTTVIMFSRRSKLTQKILVPLITRAALTVTAGSMGLIYGLVLGVVAYGGIVAEVLPQLSPLVIVAFVIYGHALGTNYGLLLEDVDLSRPAVFSRDDESRQESISLIEYDPNWRPRRPASGALLLMAAGSIIAGIPLQQGVGVTTGPSPAALGIVVGAMLVACGVFALVKPQLSTVIGVTAVGLSILSIVGAFGGLFVGMVLGLVGGTRCIVWEDPKEADTASNYGFIRVGEPDQSSGD